MKRAGNFMMVLCLAAFTLALIAGAEEASGASISRPKELDDVVGSLTETGYENKFFNLKVELEGGWIGVDQDELDEMNADRLEMLQGINGEYGENLKQYTCFYADSKEDHAMLSMVVTNASSLGTLLKADTIIDMSMDELETAYRMLGVGELSTEKITIEFMGEENVPCAYTHGTKGGLDIYFAQVFVIEDSYLMLVRATVFLDDNVQTVLDLVQKLDPEA